MKNKNKELTLIKIALWGYSTVMILFLTFFTLIPTGAGSGPADPIAGISSLLPIILFLILVIFERKKYKWNALKVSLFVYSWILIVLFSLAVFYVIKVSSQMGVTEQSGSSFLGFLYIPVLLFFVLVGYESFT